MKEINNLGNFNTIEEVWKKHPNGGKEGDYLFCDGLKYAWNKFLRMWDLMSYIITTPSRKADVVNGDLIVNNNLVVGGTLRAKHVKQPNCGLFSSVESLKKKYPNPEVGMWATVGDTVPAPIYRCDVPGEWTATGEMGGLDAMDWDRMEKAEEDIIDLSETPIFSLRADAQGDRYTPQFTIASPNKTLMVTTTGGLLQTKTYLIENETTKEQLTRLNIDCEPVLCYLVRHDCLSAGNSGTKVIEWQQRFSYVVGANIFVKFNESNTFDGATLKIADWQLPLVLDGEQVSPQNTWKAGETVMLTLGRDSIEVTRLNDNREFESTVSILSERIAELEERMSLYHPIEYVIEYGVITATLTYTRAENAAGSKSVPTLSYQQERFKVYADGKKVTMTPVKSGATLDYHLKDYVGTDIRMLDGGIVEWSQNGATTNRHVLVELNITMNGVEKTVLASASQAAAEITSTYEYRNLEATISYAAVPSDGGSVSPVVHYSQQKWRVYSNGEEEFVETISTGAEISYRLEAPVSGVELRNNGDVFWNKNTVTQIRSAKVIMTVSLNGLTVDVEGDTVQNAASLKAYYGASVNVPTAVDMTNSVILAGASQTVSIKTESTDRKKVHWVAVPLGYRLSKVLDVDNDDVTSLWEQTAIDGYSLYYYNAGVYYSNTSKITISKS